MTQYIPPFLQRLTLGLEADARSIRRAYARELKLIDQETDLHGFQALRDMYENALAWAARKERAEPAPVPAPAPALMQLDAEDAPQIAAPRPAPLAAVQEAPLPGAVPNALANAGALAETVYGRFSAIAEALAAEGAIEEIPRWEAELRARLDDDELLNITARNLFERRIAQLLFDGGTLACGPLFGAAAAVFNWEHDRRRLQQFGHAGAFLDRVIDERTMFQGQEKAELTKQGNVMGRLRKGRAPSTLQLRRDMFYVERMVTRFPNFMSVMVIPQVVQQWRDEYRQISADAPAQPDVMPEPVLDGYSAKRGSDKAWIFFVFLGLVQLFRMFGSLPSLDSRPDYTYQAPADTSSEPKYAPGVEPGKRKGEPGYGEAPAEVYRPPFAMPSGVPPSKEAVYAAVLDAIAKDISYRPAAGMSNVRRSVVYDALSTANGELYGVNVVWRSTDRAYDDAVKAAILRAKPLPPALRGSTRMEFRYTPGQRHRKTK